MVMQITRERLSREMAEFAVQEALESLGFKINRKFRPLPSLTSQADGRLLRNCIMKKN